MLLYLVYLVFILTVAMAAGGVFLSAKLQKKHNHDLFSPMLYYQVFIYTFGFYGIWGQVLIRTLFPAYLSPDVLTRFYDIALLLGLPFVIFAWMMLLQFSSVISGNVRNNWFAFGFLVINIAVIILIGYITGKAASVGPLYLIKYYFIIANFVYTAVASIQIYYAERGSYFIKTSENRKIAIGVFIVMIIQSALLIAFTSQTLLAILFIFAFFAGNTFLPVYITYGIRMEGSVHIPVMDLTFDGFCKRYEVSPRESDIVREICNGLSNKEISEKLFISLQTVKDHTHRIYIKTNVRSRVQLINLVKEISDRQ
jgi:DNA-binding CsgD family transcriptional regulator